MERHVVATVGEIAPGGSKLVTVKGRPIALFNVEGEYFAFFDTCPHAGASLCRGKIVRPVESREPGSYRLVHERPMLRCPWHGWQFDVRSGEAWCDPQTLKARNYPVAVASGSELVKGPYRAETFSVAVERDYIVIEI
jgi:3-phenylpropionate/trans-cinnamate dioxygenase ferredoxin subunit